MADQATAAQVLMQAYLDVATQRQRAIDNLALQLKAQVDQSARDITAKTNAFNAMVKRQTALDERAASLAETMISNDSQHVNDLQKSASRERQAYITAMGGVVAARERIESDERARQEQKIQTVRQRGIKRSQDFTDGAGVIRGPIQGEDSKTTFFKHAHQVMNQRDYIGAKPVEGVGRAAFADDMYKDLSNQAVKQTSAGWWDANGNRIQGNAVSEQDIRDHMSSKYGLEYGTDYGIHNTGDYVVEVKKAEAAKREAERSMQKIQRGKGFDPSAAVRMGIISGNRDSEILRTAHTAIFNKLNLKNPEMLGGIKSATDLHLFMTEPENQSTDLYKKLDQERAGISSNIRELLTWSNSTYTDLQEKAQQEEKRAETLQRQIEEQKGVATMSHEQIMARAHSLYTQIHGSQAERNRDARWRQMKSSMDDAFADLPPREQLRIIKTMPIPLKAKRHMRRFIKTGRAMTPNEERDAIKAFEGYLAEARAESTRLTSDLQETVVQRATLFGHAHKNEKGEVDGVYYGDQFVPTDEITANDAVAVLRLVLDGGKADLTEEELEEHKESIEKIEKGLYDFSQALFTGAATGEAEAGIIENIRPFLEVEPMSTPVAEEDPRPAPTLPDEGPMIIEGSLPTAAAPVPEAEAAEQRGGGLDLNILDGITGGAADASDFKKKRQTRSISAADTVSTIMLNASGVTGDNITTKDVGEVAKGVINQTSGAEIHKDVEGVRSTIAELARLSVDSSPEDRRSALKSAVPGYGSNQKVTEDADLLFQMYHGLDLPAEGNYGHS